MPTPFRYSSTKVPDGGNAGVSASLGTAGPGGTFPINFTGGTLDPGGFHPMPSKFTVGGWVRRVPGFTGIIFQAGPFFWIDMNSQGQVEARFTYGRPVVSGNYKIDDGNWHYVGATFGYPPNSIYGTLTVYVDGEQAGIDYQVGPAGGANSTPAACQLGGMNGFFQFATWAMWSDVVDAWLWGGKDNEASLVGAWDFADGPATDVSGQSHPATVPGQVWHVPCLSIGPGSGTQPAAADGLNPGGGPFTVMCWAYVTSAASPATYFLLTNAGGAVALQLFVLIDGAGAPNAAFRFGVGNTAPYGQAKLPAPAQWAHVALTYDGNQLILYVNGTQATSTPAAANHPLIQTPNVAIGNRQGPSALYMQALSIWTEALSGSAIQGYMNGNDPTGEARCTAFYPLVYDMGNAVTGTSLSPVGFLSPGGTATIADCDLALAAMEAAPATRSISSRDVPSTEGPTLQTRDFDAIATENGIDITAMPDPAAAAPALAWFEQFLQGADAQTADNLRNAFARNLNVEMQLRQRGITTGTDTLSAEGNDVVVRRSTPSGPVEVARVTLPYTPTPYQEWCAKIAYDVVSVVLAMLGIVSSAAQITESVTFEQTIMEEFGRIANLSKNADRNTWGFSTVWNTMKWLYENKLWLKVLWKAVFQSESWWGVFFMILSIIGQIALWVEAPYVELGAKIVAWGLTIGKLTDDLLHPPPPAAA
jgi:hypothetical protein